MTALSMNKRAHRFVIAAKLLPWSVYRVNGNQWTNASKDLKLPWVGDRALINYM